MCIMKILLVGDYPDDPRLGSAKVPHKLAEEFRALGHRCDMLFAQDLGKYPRSMHPRQVLGPVLAERAIARAFRCNGPYDVVDIASGEGLGFGLARRLGACRGTVFISRSHGLEHLNYRRMIEDHRAGLLYKPWTRRWWYPLVRLNQVAGAARLADYVLVLNDADRAFAIACGWKENKRVIVIEHGISTGSLEETPGNDRARGAGILFCGSWTGMKGIDYLVPAFTRLIDGGTRANLTILGGGVSEEIVRAEFPRRIQQHLTVQPRAAEQAVLEAYRRHDLLVSCSTYEGFGMVVLEAMSQGLPVVATPVGCVPALIRHGETGLLVPARDSQALTDALRLLLNDASLRARLAANAFERVRHMTWRNSALKTLEIYTRALRERTASSRLTSCNTIRQNIRGPHRITPLSSASC